MATNRHDFLGNLISLGLVRVCGKNLYKVPFAEMLKRNLGFVIDLLGPHSPYIDVI